MFVECAQYVSLHINVEYGLGISDPVLHRLIFNIDQKSKSAWDGDLQNFKTGLCRRVKKKGWKVLGRKLLLKVIMRIFQVQHNHVIFHW